MDKYVLPVFKDRPLDQISRVDLQRFFNRLPGVPLAESSIAKIKIVLSGVLNLAVRDGIIPSNPCEFVRIAAVPEPEKRALTFEEVATLIDSAPKNLKPFVILTAFGLRIGEACGATRHGTKDRVLRVRQQVLQPKGGAQLSPKLKTPQSKRDLPLPSRVWDEILGCGQVSGVFLCSDAKGGYMLPSNAYDDFKDLVTAVGLEPLSPHEMRHTFISLLELELECPGPIVDELAGRKRSDYRHASQEQKTRWLDTFWKQIEAARVARKTSGEGLGLDQASTG
jgi:integrase